MSLKKEAIDKIKAYGFDVDKLIAAIKADAETDFEVPEFVAIKQTDLDARDANKLAEGKRAGETEGEKKGRELASKAFKKKFALEDTVPNDPDKVVEAVNDKLNKGDKALQEQVAALLKDKETLTAEKASLETQSKQALFESSLIGMFPAKRNGDLTDSERLMILKANFEFVDSEGNKIAKRDGKIVQDGTTHAPTQLKKVIEDFFTERKWTSSEANPGGRGDGDNPPPGGGDGKGIKSLSKFTEKWKAENPGKNDVSPEFDTALQKHVKEVPDFDYYT